MTTRAEAAVVTVIAVDQEVCQEVEAEVDLESVAIAVERRQMIEAVSPTTPSTGATMKKNKNTTTEKEEEVAAEADAEKVGWGSDA